MFGLFHGWMQVSEFCAYARAAKPTEDTPHIEECIQLFNGLTIWVVCNILRELTIVKRAIIIEKFVDCTKVGPGQGSRVIWEIVSNYFFQTKGGILLTLIAEL